MTINEAIEKREELLAEQRKLRQAVKILKSESIPENYNINRSINEFHQRIDEIDDEIKQLANEISKPVEIIAPTDTEYSEREILIQLLMIKRAINDAPPGTKFIWKAKN